MANKNCLENIKCPKCGQEDQFKIVAETTVLVSDDGTEDCGGGYDWDHDSFCQCTECEHEGKLSDFYITKTESK